MLAIIHSSLTYLKPLPFPGDCVDEVSCDSEIRVSGEFWAPNISCQTDSASCPQSLSDLAEVLVREFLHVFLDLRSSRDIGVRVKDFNISFHVRVLDHRDWQGGASEPESQIFVGPLLLLFWPVLLIIHNIKLQTSNTRLNLTLLLLGFLFLVNISEAKELEDPGLGGVMRLSAAVRLLEDEAPACVESMTFWAAILSRPDLEMVKYKI